MRGLYGGRLYRIVIYYRGSVVVYVFIQYINIFRVMNRVLNYKLLSNRF